MVTKTHDNEDFDQKGVIHVLCSLIGLQLLFEALPASNISSPVHCHATQRKGHLSLRLCALCAGRFEAMCIQPLYAKAPKTDKFDFVPDSFALIRGQFCSLDDGDGDAQ